MVSTHVFNLRLKLNTGSGKWGACVFEAVLGGIMVLFSETLPITYC